jgi:hypothetical protein
MANPVLLSSWLPCSRLSRLLSLVAEAVLLRVAVVVLRACLVCLLTCLSREELACLDTLPTTVSRAVWAVVAPTLPVMETLPLRPAVPPRA